MSGIFGIIHRDGSPCDRPRLEVLRTGMADWGRSGCHVWHDGPAGLGQARSAFVPEDRFDRLPARDESGAVVFTGSGRIDNRDELAAGLGLSAFELSSLADSEVLMRSYERWGEDACERIYGDWSFAAWHPREQRLVLARDHFGNTSLHYHAGPRYFAFASSPTAILQLGLIPSQFDELYLGQLLTGWAFDGARTIHPELNRLPPAHVLRVDGSQLSLRCYWHPEQTPVVKLARREDYFSAFREVFDEAVRARLRGTSTPAVTLSGGLDTGSITAVAAKILAASNRRLPAFTWIPICDTDRFVAPYFGNELPYAEATAAAAGNVDLETIDASDLSPIVAIRRGLALFEEPSRGPANFPWLFQLMERTAARGSPAILTGQFGNFSVSWEGSPFSHPLPEQLRLLGPAAWVQLRLYWLKAALVGGLPKNWATVLRHRRTSLETWCRRYALRPEFARRLDLQRRALPESVPSPLIAPKDHRTALLRLGRGVAQTSWAQWGSVSGVEVRDPTADPRVIRFTLSVPDEVFTDPATKSYRWLIREAMRDLLPDSVRLNRNVGRQAADYVVRLRNCAAEVDEALEEISSGPAADYLDLQVLRRLWAEIRTQDSHPIWIQAVTTFPRSLMAGLFLSGRPRRLL